MLAFLLQTASSSDLVKGNASGATEKSDQNSAVYFDILVLPVDFIFSYLVGFVILLHVKFHFLIHTYTMVIIRGLT